MQSSLPETREVEGFLSQSGVRGLVIELGPGSSLAAGVGKSLSCGVVGCCDVRERVRLLSSCTMVVHTLT